MKNGVLNVFEFMVKTGSDMQGVEVALTYEQINYDTGYKFVERYGVISIERGNGNKSKYKQFEFFKTIKEASERSTLLRSITNNNYVNFKIIEKKDWD